MTEIAESGDKLNPSEASAELIKKAAELKEKTAKLKERMETTQEEVSKILNPDSGSEPEK